MYMLPRDHHCITPTPSCGSSNIVPPANPEWLDPVLDGPSSFTDFSIVSLTGNIRTSLSEATLRTSPTNEITPTPHSSLDYSSKEQRGCVPGDVGLLYRRLGRHLSLPIQNFVPKRDCPSPPPESDESNEPEDARMLCDDPPPMIRSRGKWKAVPPSEAIGKFRAPVDSQTKNYPSREQSRTDRGAMEASKRAEQAFYDQAAAKWEKSLLGTPNLLPTPHGVKQLIALGVPAHHCSVEDAVEDPENAHQGCSKDDAYVVDSLFIGPTPCPNKRRRFTYDWPGCSGNLGSSEITSAPSTSDMADVSATHTTPVPPLSSHSFRRSPESSMRAFKSALLSPPIREPMSPFSQPPGHSSSATLTPFAGTPAAVIKASPWGTVDMTPHRSYQSDFL